MSIKPPKLQAGDGIGIVAPASPVEPGELQTAMDLLISKGYNVITAPHLYDSLDYLAGGDDVRLEDLHYMFSNTDIKAVLCARGGYGTPRLLDRIDFALIEQNPKIIVGYSDMRWRTSKIWPFKKPEAFLPAVSEKLRNSLPNYCFYVIFKSLGGDKNDLHPRSSRNPKA